MSGLTRSTSSHDLWGKTEKQEAHRRFRLQLETRSLKQLLGDQARLQALRFDWDKLRALKKMLANALLEEKVDLELAVLKATDCSWDEEDDQKYQAQKPRSKVGAPVGQQGGDDQKGVDDALPEPGDVGLRSGQRELDGGAVALPNPDEVLRNLRLVRLAHFCKDV